jgi:hypothetical protein
MHPNRAYWQLLLPIMIFGLTGCAGFELRKGPSPVIDGTAVYTASDNKLVLLGALERDAGLDQGPAPPDYYYQVAEAGFNYVDDQCRSYFDELFFLNKGREQVKSGLAATGQTTLAILGITGAAVPTLTIVAQAFGLASAATDIVTGTYLYALPPATTQSFVERLQLAFRAQASSSSASVRSPAAAYYLIQRYLNLCLPPTIEAEITKQISNTSVVGQPVTNAVGQPVGGGEFFSLATFSNVPPPPRAGFAGSLPVTLRQTAPAQTSSTRNSTIAQSRALRAADRVVPTTPHINSGGLPGAVTLSEEEMSAAQLARIQGNVLCIPETPVFDRRTRDGIKIFQQTQLGAPTGQIEVAEREELIRRDHGKPCPTEAQNFFELTRYFSKGELQTSKVIELQQLLNSRPDGGRIDETGQLNSATRNKIAAVRQGMANLTDQPSATQQVTLPFFLELKR